MFYTRKRNAFDRSQLQYILQALRSSCGVKSSSISITIPKYKDSPPLAGFPYIYIPFVLFNGGGGGGRVVKLDYYLCMKFNYLRTLFCCWKIRRGAQACTHIYTAWGTAAKEVGQEWFMCHPLRGRPVRAGVITERAEWSGEEPVQEGGDEKLKGRNNSRTEYRTGGNEAEE
jgi:hypothetical protein